MKNLAIITTHPIQYNAPLFAMMHQRGILAVKVFYTWGDSVLQSKFDPGFNRPVKWDIPLLDGYEYEFLKNAAKEKGSHHYKGIINPEIIKRISEWKPDAVLVFGWKFHSHLKVMRYFKNKIPVWFRGDSILPDKKKNVASLLKTLLLKWVYKHVDIAFYTGTNNKKYFLQYGLKPRQLIRAYHAVDNCRFLNNSQNSISALEWKARLNIRLADFVFLYAGKLEPTKNVEGLLKAFSTLSLDNVHLVIVGNGPEEFKLKDKYQFSRNVHFIDFQNQKMMPVVYQLCDVFVLPSTGETWGLGINEAMAAGKVILASDKCGGAVDLVKETENGFIFKAGDIPDLTLKMQTLVELKDQIPLMKQKSNQLIQQFTFKELVTAIESQMTDGKNR